MSKMSDDVPDMERIFCNRCGIHTNHKVLATFKTSDSEFIEGHGKIWWNDQYDTLHCLGCESVTLRHSHSFSEYPDLEVTYYPPRVSRRSPTWASKLPYDMRWLLGEIYAALYADSRRLAMMGARALLDMLILEKVGDIGTFQEKLDKLENEGIVGKKNKDYLSAALDAGSAAAHRGYAAKVEEVNYVMDIVENLLETVYALGEAADIVKRSTPPRKKRA